MKYNKFFTSPDGEDPKHAYHSILEQKLKLVLSPIERFTKTQIMTSIILLFCTVIALFLATNQQTSSLYNYLINLPISIQIGEVVLKEPLEFWVNDILLTFFFFTIGLEIKREFLVGELVEIKRTILIVCAAIGGIIMPAIIYILCNLHQTTISGWAIPTATDTAFSLGILSCFRSYLPKGIFTFMAALTILDDICGILILGIFYSHNVNMHYLNVAILLLICLVVCDFAGVRKPWPYIILGSTIWFFTEAAGIHGTLAGIMIAFTIPARPQYGPIYFINSSRRLINYFENRKRHTPLVLQDDRQHAALQQLQLTALDASTPLQRWLSALQLPIMLFILPLFAVINAGIDLHSVNIFETLLHPISRGIIFGLVIGKPFGILLGANLAYVMGIGKLPKDTDFTVIISSIWLTGIGFTMSIFISNLAFEAQLINIVMAKTGILIGSLMSCILGIISLIANSFICKK
ncbi:MAG: Na+/H+ antiporter NhaA [Gammaproteobacteria bacterium]